MYFVLCIWISTAFNLGSLFIGQWTGHVGTFMAMQFVTAVSFGAFIAVNMALFVRATCKAYMCTGVGSQRGYPTPWIGTLDPLDMKRGHTDKIFKVATAFFKTF